jgi:transcriptional regulatory protein RtcR
MNNIVFSVFDPEWDGGDHKNRWERWRPTLSLLSHDDLAINRIELIVQTHLIEMAQVTIEDMKSVSPETQIIIHKVEMKDPWDFEEVYGSIHDIAESYSFKPKQNNYYAHMSTGTHVSRICLFLLCEARLIPGSMIQSYPDNTYENKGKAGWQTIDLSLTKYDRLAKRFEKRKSKGQVFLKSGIETRNREFNNTIEEIEQVSIHSKHPILITGPTGAGKSVLANRIFELKENRHQLCGDFIPVNCATLRGDGAMSTLFGHKKGSFTGATNDRRGLLKSADNGLLFLDEIAELGLEEQAMLLTALEKGKFHPVGSDSETSSSFQLIAGTNKDLHQQVHLGLFREDLLSRINLWQFALPSLKDRSEDIEPNIEFELAKFSSQAGRKISFNQPAYKHYLKFCHSSEADWKGNFRDLNASITRLGTLATGGRIDLIAVEKEITRLKAAWGSSQQTSINLNKILDAQSIDNMDLFDRLQLEQAITVCTRHTSLSKAGRALYNHSRKQRETVNDGDRLRKYLAKFNLDWNSITSSLEP